MRMNYRCRYSMDDPRDFRSDSANVHWQRPYGYLSGSSYVLSSQMWGYRAALAAGTPFSLVLVHVPRYTPVNQPRSQRVDACVIDIFDVIPPQQVFQENTFPSWNVPTTISSLVQAAAFVTSDTYSLPGGGGYVAYNSSGTPSAITNTTPPGPINNNLKVDVLNNLLAAPFSGTGASPVTFTPTGGDVYSAASPNLQMSLVSAPGFMTSVGSVNSGQFTLNTPGYSITAGCGATIFSPNFNQVTLGLSLYVHNFSESSGTVRGVRDIVQTATQADSEYDYLDYEIDSYLPVVGFHGNTGRRWRLQLPYPIILGSGQALLCTVSIRDTQSYVSPVYAFYGRSMVTAVA